MRIFVTGATGFIGTELVKELIAEGHTVCGLTRSDAGAGQLAAAGAEAHRGDIQDLGSLRDGAKGMDAVVHLAFNHDDMTKFAESGRDERAAIEAMGEVLEAGKLLVVTSGTGLASGGPGHVRLETDPPLDTMPRQPEGAARAVAERGVRVAIVRLPQVHDTRKQGLVPYLTETARQKRVSAYVGDGANRWAAAPLGAVSELYRLALAKTGPGVTVYHAVQEEGVSLKEIAETIGKGIWDPGGFHCAGEGCGTLWLAGPFCDAGYAGVRCMDAEDAGWEPTGPGLIEDLTMMKYVQPQGR